MIVLLMVTHSFNKVVERFCTFAKISSGFRISWMTLMFFFFQRKLGPITGGMFYWRDLSERDIQRRSVYFFGGF